MYDLNKARDFRTLKQYKRDFNFGLENEKKVMHQLVAEFVMRGFPIDCVFSEPINKAESFKDNEVVSDYIPHIVPDYFFSYGNSPLDMKQLTFEIKVCRSDTFENDFIHIKCPSIIEMIKNPKEYPNGRLIVACRKQFAMMKASTVGKYPIELVEIWNKKVFKIPTEDLQWRQWSIDLEI